MINDDELEVPFTEYNLNIHDTVEKQIVSSLFKKKTKNKGNLAGPALERTGIARIRHLKSLQSITFHFSV